MATEAQNDSRALVRRDLAALFALAWPVVISRLGMMTMGLSDAIVVGRYSAIELGWHAIAWAPTTVVLVVGTALLGGVQVMTARAIGEGRPEETGGVLRRGLVYGVWVGLISALVLFALGPFLLGLLLALLSLLLLLLLRLRRFAKRPSGDASIDGRNGAAPLTWGRRR